MSLWRLLFWGIAALAALIPINWARLWAIGDLPKDTTAAQLLVAAAVCWLFAAGLCWMLLVSARGAKANRAKEALALQALLAQPLTEVRPKQALMKPEERAYATALASLQEMQTVGFRAGTASTSVRLAKGWTVRTAGTRGRVVKGLVSTSTGELVVTDKRIIFAGDRKSFAIALERLLNTTNYTDGFGFSDNKTTYTLIVEDPRAHQAFAIALDKVLQRGG